MLQVQAAVGMWLDACTCSITILLLEWVFFPEM